MIDTTAAERTSILSTLPPKILIVDDGPVNVELLEGILQEEGFGTLRADDGPSARAIGRAERPDLILLDVVMPGESGFETCALLKSDPLTADIPVIFLSKLDDIANKVNGLRIGGVDFISKPVHGEEVLARVRVHLRIREDSRAAVRRQQDRLEELRHAQRSILVRPDDCPEASFGVYYEPLEEAAATFMTSFGWTPAYSATLWPTSAGTNKRRVPDIGCQSSASAVYGAPLFTWSTMRGVDAVMRQMLGAEQYLTACYAHLNRRTRRLSVVSAGHPPLILVSATGTAQVVRMDSTALGTFGALALQRKDIRVSLGDRFFLYSDGLIEGLPGGSRRAGLDLLIDACIRHSILPLQEAINAIAGQVRPSGIPAAADLVLLGVEVTP